MYNNKVYLSSTSSTVIYDDATILTIKALKKANSVVEQQNSATPVDLSQPRAGTLENLLILSPSTVRTVDYPVLRYRLELDSVKDHLSLSPALSNLIGTDHVMEIKSHIDYDYETFESFTCWQIHPSEGIEDSVGSSSLDAVADNQPHKMDVEDSDIEDSGDSANGKGKKEALQPSDKKKKNRYIHSPWLLNVSYGSGRVGMKGMTATHFAKEKRKRYTHIPFCLAEIYWIS
ncbi:hypothetical protein Tco_0610869 [Tanacetum coccineum]